MKLYQEESSFDTYTGSYVIKLSKSYDYVDLKPFVDSIENYIQNNDYLHIYIYDIEWNKEDKELRFDFESDNNMPIDNLENIYDEFDIAVEYATKDYKVYTENLSSFNEKISDQDYSQSKKGKAYKVFRIKNGKLYPPMVANPGGKDTPVGVWLDAEEGEFAGLSKTGRKQVKSTGSGNLAYRPGWHLGDMPRAKQFDRSFSWEFVDVDDPSEAEDSVRTYTTFMNKYAKPANVGKVYYIEELDSYVKVTDDKAPYFPYDFIWAECEYVMDVNYQDEADEQGYMRTKADGSTYRSDKYQHSLAGLPKLPKNGYYKYRTNPNPDTVPWVITGAIKVTKLLDDYDVENILGGNAPERQGGNKTLSELGF